MTENIRYIDLFAGPGGFEVGMRHLGLDGTGVEWDDNANNTAEMAGFTRIRGDVSLLDPMRVQDAIRATAPCFVLTLLHGSPPCQGFSMAGKGEGRKDAQRLIDAYRTFDPDADQDALIAEFKATAHDPRSALTLEPLRWWAALRPEYVSLEQVPTVLPIWGAFAENLRAHGYSVWTGNVQAEQYGIVATCPFHDHHAPSAGSTHSFGLTALASADPAGTAWVECLDDAMNAKRRATYERNLNAVLGARTGNGTTSPTTESVANVWNVALLLRVALDAASDAIWHSRVNDLARLVLSGLQTPHGREGASWTSEATSTSVSTESIDESIESLLKDTWGALCNLARSYTTSTGASTTTAPTISPSSAATPTTLPTIGQGAGAGMTALGAKAWCGACLSVAVPQTRKRAVLLASRVHEVTAPAPTHSKYHTRSPQRLDEGVLPWVSMAEALGWGAVQRPSWTVTGGGTATGGAEPFGHGARDAIAAMRSNYGAGGDPANRGERAIEQPAPTMTGKAGRNKWIKVGPNAKATQRQVDQPAPTLFFGHQAAGVQWIDRDDVIREVREREPRSGQNDTDKADWPDVIAAPGYRKPGDGPRQNAPGSVRVTVQEAGVLQSFPDDYPWQGLKGAQYQQVGNAYPPILAAAMVGHLIEGSKR